MSFEKQMASRNPTGLGPQTSQFSGRLSYPTKATHAYRSQTLVSHEMEKTCSETANDTKQRCPQNEHL